MFEVVFYKDKNGKEPVLDYLRSLNERSDKDSIEHAKRYLQDFAERSHEYE